MFSKKVVTASCPLRPFFWETSRKPHRNPSAQQLSSRPFSSTTWGLLNVSCALQFCYTVDVQHHVFTLYLALPGAAGKTVSFKISLEERLKDVDLSTIQEAFIIFSQEEIQMISLYQDTLTSIHLFWWPAAISPGISLSPDALPGFSSAKRLSRKVSRTWCFASKPASFVKSHESPTKYVVNISPYINLSTKN